MWIYKKGMEMQQDDVVCMHKGTYLWLTNAKGDVLIEEPIGE